jgi:hypothetical protein
VGTRRASSWACSPTAWAATVPAWSNGGMQMFLDQQFTNDDLASTASPRFCGQPAFHRRERGDAGAILALHGAHQPARLCPFLSAHAPAVSETGAVGRAVASATNPWRWATPPPLQSYGKRRNRAAMPRAVRIGRAARHDRVEEPAPRSSARSISTPPRFRTTRVSTRPSAGAAGEPDAATLVDLGPSPPRSSSASWRRLLYSTST